MDDALNTKEVNGMSFEDIEQQLTRLKPELDRYTELKKQYDHLRELAVFEMMAKGIKSTLPKNGYSLVLSRRETPAIVDEGALLDWFDANLDYDLSDYMKLDSDKVKSLAGHVLQETGEIIPGIVSQTTEFVSLKRSK